MADKEISGLTVAAALTGAEQAHVLQGANSRRVAMDNIAAKSGFFRVRVCATANVAIATALEDGDTLDGVTLAEGDLVLLTAQTAPEENGVYTVVAAAAGAASRALSFALYDQIAGAYFSVMEGTAKADTLWRCTSDRGGTIDVTALAISEFSAGGGGGATLVATHSLNGLSEIETLGLGGYSTIHLVMVNASRSGASTELIQCGDSGGYDATNLYRNAWINATNDVIALADGFYGALNVDTSGVFWEATIHNFNIVAPCIHRGDEQFNAGCVTISGQTVNAKAYDRLKVILSSGNWPSGTLYVIGQN